MIRRLFLPILFVLLIAPTLVSAQAGAWEVTVAAQLGANWNIYRITPDGVQAPIPLPAGMIISSNLTQMLVSSDLRYAVVTQSSADYSTSYPPRIADLKLGTFYELTLPFNQPGAYTMSGFDPSGTRFALSTVVGAVGPDYPWRGIFGVVDVTTGTFTDYTEQIVMTGLTSSINGWYQLGDWDADGIYMYPSCYACEPPFEGEYAQWSPDTFAYMPVTGVIFSIFAEQLAVTREIVSRAYSTDYPFSTEPTAYFPIQNILVYKPSAAFLPTFDGQTGEHEITSMSPVIFNDPNVVDLSVGQSEWVGDGQYVLALNNGSGMLINRAGGMNPINLGFQPPEVIGTTDGFLALQDNADQIIVHHFTVPGMQDQVLGSLAIGGRLFVLATPDLGATAAPVLANFTPVAANFGQLEAIMLANQPVCPGFMPSRIFPGQQARVTPGAANRLRSIASTSGDVVGQIPGGATFQVIFGPECSENTAWWYVNYEGVQGYTAEGMNGEYWVELVRP